jgi:hypothetical protein
MNQFITFFNENKSWLIPLLALVYSEFLSLNPKYKSNGIVLLIGNILGKK